MHWLRADRSLPWYEYLWAALPIGIVAAGGAIGGACGGAAAFCNIRLMQSSRPKWQKYALTGATSLAAVAAYVVLARLFLSVTGLGGMTAEKIDRELAGKPVFVAVRKADPTTYAHIRDTILEGAKQQRAQPEIEAAVQALLGSVVRKFLPVADDTAVLDLTRIVTLELDQIGAKSADACVDFLFPRPGRPPVLIGNFVTEEVLARDKAATEAVLVTGAADPRPVPQRSEVAASLNRVVRMLSDQFGAAQVAALGKPDTVPHDQLCTVSSGLYKTVLILPATEAVPLLRFLYSQGSV